MTAENSSRHIVACMKWGDAFPPDYVNVLYHAVRDHLSEPFEFVCVTNEPEGLHPDVKTQNIPDMRLPAEAWARGAWPKISLLKPGLFAEGAKVLFIDLDSMINGSMDEFFDFEDGFHAIGPTTWNIDTTKKPLAFRIIKSVVGAVRGKGALSTSGDVTDKSGRVVEPNVMGTGIFAYIAGEHGAVYEALLSDIPFALKHFANEQHFIEHHLESWSPWRPQAVTSFKYHLRQPLVLDWFLPPRRPAKGSPLLAFHGLPRPLEVATERHSSRAELPHVWFGPVAWFRDYWVRYNRAE